MSCMWSLHVLTHMNSAVKSKPSCTIFNGRLWQRLRLSTKNSTNESNSIIKAYIPTCQTNKKTEDWSFERGSWLVQSRSYKGVSKCTQLAYWSWVTWNIRGELQKKYYFTESLLSNWLCWCIRVYDKRWWFRHTSFR